MENAGSRALVRGMETNSLSLHKQQKKAKRRFCLFPLTARSCTGKGEFARRLIKACPERRAAEENSDCAALQARTMGFA